MRTLLSLSKVKRILSGLSTISNRIEDLQQAVARIENRQLKDIKSLSLQDYEFKVFSQNGEDGIIQFLINYLPIEQKIFIEFGVHNYIESNTRFLIKNNNWSGLVIDGSQKNINSIKSDPLYWQRNLKAECAFINRNNINDLIDKSGLHGDIGILSIDIDGNDYWVWQAIDCVNPRIVICEYNSLFGSSSKVSIPYDENFSYSKAHYSTLYWGASIGAFDYLANIKGYSLVGSNSNGNNIFFVRNDLLGSLQKMTPEEAYVKSTYRTSRDPQGSLTFLDMDQAFALIADLPLKEVDTGESTTLRKVFRV